MISMLATERRPSAGDALLLGWSIRDEPRAVRRMIGVAPQEIARRSAKDTGVLNRNIRLDGGGRPT